LSLGGMNQFVPGPRIGNIAGVHLGQVFDTRGIQTDDKGPQPVLTSGRKQ
jgi:hypothetical protein